MAATSTGAISNEESKFPFLMFNSELQVPTIDQKAREIMEKCQKPNVLNSCKITRVKDMLFQLVDSIRTYEDAIHTFLHDLDKHHEEELPTILQQELSKERTKRQEVEANLHSATLAAQSQAKKMEMNLKILQNENIQLRQSLKSVNATLQRERHAGQKRQLKEAIEEFDSKKRASTAENESAN